MSGGISIEVFIINYNGKNTVLPTIESLYNSSDVKVSISVIDDHSTDESPGLIKRHYPEIPLYAMPVNTKKANILRNKALQMAKSEYVFITDNDLKYDKRCILELLKIMRSDAKVATCSPRLMYWNQPDKVYTAGARLHFIGAAVSDLRDKIYQNINEEPSVNSGGGICLIRHDVIKRVGGFDENLMQGWGSDGEFYQRLLRAGYKCLYIPSAFALHENKLVVSERKYRVIGQTHNRWVFIFSHYSLPLIFLLIPAFLVYEILQAGFILMKGLSAQYLKGNLLVLKNIPYILKKRKFVQGLRVVSDKDVLYSGDIYIAPALIEKNYLVKILVRFFSSFLNFYWMIIRKIIP